MARINQSHGTESIIASLFGDHQTQLAQGQRRPWQRVWSCTLRRPNDVGEAPDGETAGPAGGQLLALGQP